MFRGRTVEELIPRIERDLGADAIVVRRREGLTGGVLGFFQHPWVEIEAIPGTAGVDVYDEPESVDAAGATHRPPPPFRRRGTPAAYQAGLTPPEMPTAAAPAPSPPPAPPPPAAPGFVPEPAYTPAYGQPPSVAPAVAPPVAPPPTFAPGAGVALEPGGSAYVTAHLAALARAAPPVPPPLVPEPPPPTPFLAAPPATSRGRRSASTSAT